jgi:hypothetical protein
MTTTSCLLEPSLCHPLNIALEAHLYKSGLSEPFSLPILTFPIDSGPVRATPELREAYIELHFRYQPIIPSIPQSAFV